MKQRLRRVLNHLRKMGFGLWVDKCIYSYNYLKNLKSNVQFIKSNPDLPVPPAYMMFESYKMNYQDYYYGGLETAKWISEVFSEFIDLNKPIKILDWGCGPSRVIRHLPRILNSASIVIGSDYNKKTIAWNTKNISGITFIQNSLSPPLSFENNTFDAIYSISVFTHLGENLFKPWIDELSRILKSDGILIITLHGQAFIVKLEKNEQENFIKDKAVIHKSNIEGHRSFGAYHPTRFVEHNIQGLFKIERIIFGEVINNIPQQDTWILRKLG